MRRLIVRFTPEEVEILKKDYLSYVPLLEIARKLGRSEGVIRQKALHLKLRRSPTLMRVLGWAPGHLKAQVHTMLPASFIKECFEWRAVEESKIKADANAEAEAHYLTIIAQSKDIDLNLQLSRNQKMVAKRMIGMTLEAIGQQYGVTRERVRQLTDPNHLASAYGMKWNDTPPVNVHTNEKRAQKRFEQLMMIWEKAPQNTKDAFVEYLKNEGVDLQWKGEEATNDQNTGPDERPDEGTDG